MLTQAQTEQFIREGYVRLDSAFPTTLAAECREMLWADTGCDPNDPATWTQPVIRLWAYAQEPFIKAANTTALCEAFDQLVGKGRWMPRDSLGTFPIRFPSNADAGDTGWHVDASFPDEDSSPEDFSTWRVNVYSRGRALLMLMLFSDVGENDAPTRIRAGSHMEIARTLAPYGEKGLSVMDLSCISTSNYPEVYATGAAGTVYLCHPFLVHAAQPHTGASPRFMAQPPLYPNGSFEIEGRNPADYVPVELAIIEALGGPASKARKTIE
ncbi:MAG: phytanoyl-CoA dioxygenase family protein [Acidobacteria bacterium]|nr:phytanoyl-CoA dioxygenase family protein [Acidobacteriota bacterium]MCW5970712.1 phytanoyl-CoA dioxygenase family protein [Blastocatellales bacterium]